MLTGLVGIAFLLLTAILLVAVRTASTAVTVRHVKSDQTFDTFAVTVQISNGTANDFIFYPSKLEAREGTGWRKVCEFRADSFHPAPCVAAHSATNFTWDAPNVRVGSTVRVTMRAQEVLTGAKGFLRRVELRRIDKTPNRVPLNPYDKNSKVFGKPIEIVTEEFIAPPLTVDK